MDKALMTYRGNEKLVSANDVQKQYRGNPPSAVKFRCPICRQPLFPAAMVRGSQQSPHFRHAPNNPRAQECELYASSYGFYATYQKVPMPMFIRRSRDDKSMFVVEGGFRPLAADAMSRLKSEGARLVIGRKEYKMTRFGAGLTKLPFYDVSLSPSTEIRLRYSSMSLNATWGYPEDAQHAMAFTRDEDSEQGKRVKLGETICRGTTLYLLAPNYEERNIRDAFGSCDCLGRAGKRLTVLGVTFPREGKLSQKATNYLERCGFKVADDEQIPEIVWPPALKSSGVVTPLFEKSPCIFTAPTDAFEERSLYVHTKSDTVGRARAIPTKMSANWRRSFGIFTSRDEMSFITTRDWIYSIVVLVHPDADAFDAVLHEHMTPITKIADEDDTFVTVKFNHPMVAEMLRIRESKERTVIDEPCAMSFDIGSNGLIRVERTLNASRGSILLLEVRKRVAESAEVDLEKTEPTLPSFVASEDILFAMSRRNGNKVPQLSSKGKRFASTRKATE